MALVEKWCSKKYSFNIRRRRALGVEAWVRTGGRRRRRRALGVEAWVREGAGKEGRGLGGGGFGTDRGEEEEEGFGGVEIGVCRCERRKDFWGCRLRCGRGSGGGEGFAGVSRLGAEGAAEEGEGFGGNNTN